MDKLKIIPTDVINLNPIQNCPILCQVYFKKIRMENLHLIFNNLFNYFYIFTPKTLKLKYNQFFLFC